MRFLVLPISRNRQVWHIHVDPTSPFFASPAANSGRSAAARYVDKGVAWGTSQWDALSKAKEGSISNKVYVYGNKVLDRVDADEVFLKSVPPLPNTPKEPGSDAIEIPVTIPTRIDQSELNSNLQALLSHRVPYHKRYLRLSALWLPLTLCFTVVPGPNIPLFWNLFRLYSHYRAAEGAKTLQELEGSKSLVFKPSVELEQELHDWDWDKTEFIPGHVVKRLVAKGFGGPQLEREVERVIQQVQRKQGSDAQAAKTESSGVVSEDHKAESRPPL